MINTWLKPIVAILLLSTLNGCVYYNKYYNAQKQFRDADSQRFESEADPDNRILANTYLDYYLSAIRKASSVLELHPESKWVDDSLLLIGKSYYWRSEHTDAIQKFDELLKNFPESELRSETLYWRALALWGNENITESRELLGQIGQSTDRIYAWQARLALAELEFAQDNHDLAVRNYLSLVDNLNDKELSVRLWKGLGDTYFANDDHANALNAYQMVLKSDPDPLTSYLSQVQIGASQELMGDLDGALKTYDRLERTKRFKRYQAKVQLLIANVYRLTGDIDGALDAYQRIISNNPRTEESAEAYYQIALIEHEVKKDLEASMELLGKARKERSTSDAAVKARALETTLFQLDKFRKRAEKETKQGTQALFSIAELYLFSLGEVDSALSAYERVLARSESEDFSAKALYGMGLIYADSLDNQPEASRLFSQLIENHPVTPYAIDARRRIGQDRSDDVLAEARYVEAEALKAEGADPQEVITILNQVAEEYPSSVYAPKALFALGWTYENDLNNPEAATAHYERLAETYPQTDFAEISEDKVKLIKKDQRDSERKAARSAKEKEEENKANGYEAETAATDRTSSTDTKKKAPNTTASKENGSPPGEPDGQPQTNKASEEAKPKPDAPPPKTPKPPPPDDGPLEAGEIEQLPRLVDAPQPEAREELMEEEDINPTVSVRLLVGKKGNVTRVIVVEGAELLREAAVDMAFQYRFEPGMHKGKPREVWMEFPITFIKPYSEGMGGEPQ